MRIGTGLILFAVWLPGFSAAGPFTFTSIDPFGTTITPADINNSGQIVGSYDSPISSQIHGFILGGGKLTTVDFPGAVTTRLAGINNTGVALGCYTLHPLLSCTNTFLFAHGMFSPLERGGHPVDINDAGDILFNEGLLSGDTFTPIAFPGAEISTFPSGLNNAGVIVGTYATFDPDLENHGFIFRDGKYETFEGPRPGFTQLTDISDSRVIIGPPSTSPAGSSFMYADDEFTVIAFPGSPYTEVTGINARGQIVGVYSAERGPRGFVATPIPEPGSFGLIILGLMAGALARRRVHESVPFRNQPDHAQVHREGPIVRRHLPGG